MTASLLHMANHLDASTNRDALNYVLLGKPHSERTPHHPSYLEMIKGAVQAINSGNGSTKTSILKYIAMNYHVAEDLKKISGQLSMILDKAVGNGELEETAGQFMMRRPTDNTLQIVVPIKPPHTVRMLKALASTHPMPITEVNVRKRTMVVKPIAENQKQTKKSVQKNDQIGKVAKTKSIGKKRTQKMAKKPKAMPNTKPKSKGPPKRKEMKPEGAPTITMKLRTGTRKHYN